MTEIFIIFECVMILVLFVLIHLRFNDITKMCELNFRIIGDISESARKRGEQIEDILIALSVFNAKLKALEAKVGPVAAVAIFKNGEKMDISKEGS